MNSKYIVYLLIILSILFFSLYIIETNNIKNYEKNLNIKSNDELFKIDNNYTDKISIVYYYDLENNKYYKHLYNEKNNINERIEITEDDYNEI